MLEGSQISGCKAQAASDLLARESRPPEQLMADDLSQDLAYENADYRRLVGQEIISKWAKWATVAGFIPLPVLDTAAISGLQILMAKELCGLYGVPFKRKAAISIILAVTGSSVTSFVSAALGAELIKKIPVVGTVLDAALQPSTSYILTYALGSIFVRHFEKQGSLHDFPIAEGREVFLKKYNELKQKYFKKTSSDSVA